MGGPRAWTLLCLGLLLPGGGAAWNVPGARFSGRRNWCSYVVTRTVSCHVQNGTYLQRVLQSCPWPVGCPGNSYRTVVRPMYKVMYKTVTAREWRCCPGHSGVTCEEGSPGFLEPTWSGSSMRRMTVRPTAFSGCLNCSKVSELTERLRALEAKGEPGPKGDPGEKSHWGEGLHQLREALKILAERVLILETMIGLYEPDLGSGAGPDGTGTPSLLRGKRGGHPTNYQIITPRRRNERS
ncbi:rCG36120, isoform CRA_c [Rattus norvegicus]|uniref:RCG36120, isoform CRA_c n=1 Tax=Rattus norvegicus TaxID=10116 RepID=A6IKL2_RAT|nr:rCG36120, isoform CRA_c [Rattus norvegicus]